MALNYLLAVICLLPTFATAAEKPGGACLGFLQTIPINVPVRLLFAGRTPLFMRSKEWEINHLSEQLNAIATSKAWRERSTLLNAFDCPVVHTNVVYRSEILSHSSTISLDGLLKSALQKAGNRRLPAEALADKFSSVLPSYQHRSGRKKRGYDVLMYSPVFTSSEADYGYFAQSDGKLGSIGISNEKRFLFLDVSARPFAFEANPEPAPGEIMFTVSRNMTAYAQEVHRFLLNILIPPFPSDGAGLVKKAKAIHFVTVVVDANEIVVQEQLVDHAGHTRHLPGVTFEQKRFENLVKSVTKPYALGDDGYNVTFSTASLQHEDALSMALTRSVDFSATDIGVRQADLLPDIVSVAMQFKSPSESVLLIPVFVLSFADALRHLQFQDGTQAYSHPVSPVIVSLENRLESGASFPSDTTLHCARKALERVFALNPTTMSLPGTTNSSFSQTIVDISERHYIGEKLRLSAGSSLEKAMSALNYSGYDEIARAHLKTKAIGRLRHSVVLKLSSLMRECRHWVRSSKAEEAASHVSDLRAAAQTLSDTMIAVVCQKMVGDDIVRDVQAAKSRFSPFSCFIVTVLGFAFGFYGLQVVTFAFKRNPTTILPQQTLTSSPSDSSVGQWFSTLHLSASKSKRS